MLTMISSKVGVATIPYRIYPPGRRLLVKDNNNYYYRLTRKLPMAELNIAAAYKSGGSHMTKE